MCGIAGFMGGNFKAYDAQYTLDRMGEAIANRGPDFQGSWIDSAAGIGLVHRRLSIVDLSDAGHQPMQSESNRYVIVFNGEIYNHNDIRQELDQEAYPPSWRGYSDTETILAAFSAWGVVKALEKFIGMFAFALWDKSERTLILGRDRVGEKPLYYGWLGSGDDAAFVFGSELKAMKMHSAFNAEIDRGALALLMRNNYVPSPYSIYCGVRKLMPGTLLTLPQNQREPFIESYWSLPNKAVIGNQNKFSESYEQAVENLDELLRNAVRKQMIADVPLGAFLSGGIDSSTIVSLMQTQSSQPVKTFTVGFNENDFNEAVHARKVAQYLGTDHTELYVTPQQALDVIPQIPKLFSEPFCDSSQVAMILVSKLAREKVTVCLTGDGGDEIFAGYNRYAFANSTLGRLNKLPDLVRSVLAVGIHSISPAGWNRIAEPIQFLLPRSSYKLNMGEKIHKGADILSTRNVCQYYGNLISHWDSNELVLSSSLPISYLDEYWASLESLDDVQRMMVIDSTSYLPDDILVKVDRATMGASMESRVPFLDHRVIEFAWSLPQHFKIKRGIGKSILRDVLYKYVPKDLVDRPKMGFGVPIDSWLRGPLREWAEELLDERRLRQEGFFNPTLIRSKWAEHLSGKRNWQYHLWGVLMFQSWLECEGAI